MAIEAGQPETPVWAKAVEAEAREFRRQFGLGEFHPDAPEAERDAYDAEAASNGRGEDAILGETKSPENTPKSSVRPKTAEDVLITVLPSTWTDEPPPLDWIVQDCFLRHTVAMLSGDGGLGKSLLGQQLLTASNLGKSWLGLDTKSCRGLGVFCEDDYAELQRRQAAINRLYDCAPADLADRTEYISLAGQDAIMAEFDAKTNQANILPLFDKIRQRAIEMKAQIVLLDTLADVFGGNEINRAQARRFVHLLRRIAIEIDGVVILTAHPSLVGLNTGTGLSGSTAWNNSVRSRLYLTKIDGELSPGTEDERILKTMKNNQGALGGEIRIKWQHGAFIPLSQPGPLGVVEKADLDGRLVEKLREMVNFGSVVPADWNNKNGFANVMRRQDGFHQFKQTDMLNAQVRLIAQGRIVKVDLGPPSKRISYLRASDQTYPAERKTT